MFKDAINFTVKFSKREVFSLMFYIFGRKLSDSLKLESFKVIDVDMTVLMCRFS